MKKFTAPEMVELKIAETADGKKLIWKRNNFTF